MFVSVKRAAEILDVGVNTIYAHIHYGRLTPYKPFGKKVYIKEVEIYDKIEAGREVTSAEMGRLVELDKLDKRLHDMRKNDKENSKIRLRRK